MSRPLYILKILFFTAVVFALFGGVRVHAQPLGPHTEVVGVNARVGEDVVLTPGGSGSVGFFGTGVRFTGEAYPNANVTIMKEGIDQLSVKADARGLFSISLPEAYNANILYSLYAEDVLGNRSLLINYPLVVKVGFITHLSGVRFPPTIVTDKSEVKFGDYITVSGYALPNKNLKIEIFGFEGSQSFSLTSALSGAYKSVLPLSGLARGEYTVSIKYEDGFRVSKLIKFIIGELNVFNQESLRNIPGDCNADFIINLVDFSILAFWYGKDNPPACVDTNRDKKIDLTDFSILAFYWTG